MYLLYIGGQVYRNWSFFSTVDIMRKEIGRYCIILNVAKITLNEKPLVWQLPEQGSLILNSNSNSHYSVVHTDRSNDNGTLTNKYYWKEGTLNEDKIP